MGKVAVILELEELIQMIRDIVRQELEELSLKQPKVEQKPEWLTRKQVADYFFVSLGTIDNLTRSGILKKHYLGRSPRFKRDEVLQAFESFNKFQRYSSGRKR